MIPERNSKNGAILILALWVLSTMSLLSLGMAYRARVELKLAGNYFNQVDNTIRMESAVYSIINVMLSDETKEYDSAGEFEQIAQAYSEDNIEVKIIDEGSKYNINNVSEEQLQILNIRDFTANNILNCRPYNLIDELILIEGVTPLIYNGSQRVSSRGLKDIFSVWSAERININTAAPEVLSLIPEVDAASVSGIESYRRYSSFESTREIAAILGDSLGIPGEQVDQLTRSVTSVSSIFRVQCSARGRAFNSSLNVVFQIDKQIKILEWRTN